MIGINTQFGVAQVIDNDAFTNLTFNQGINHTVCNGCFSFPLNASVSRFVNRATPNVTARLRNSMTSKWVHGNRAGWASVRYTGHAPSPTTIDFDSRVFVKLVNWFILFTTSTQSIHVVSVSQRSVVRGVLPYELYFTGVCHTIGFACCVSSHTSVNAREINRE